MCVYFVRGARWKLTGPMTLRSSTSSAFSIGALSGSFGGGRMRVGRSLPPSSDIVTPMDVMMNVQVFHASNEIVYAKGV